MLEKINSPRDLDKLTYEQLNRLSGEIRKELITTVSANGGHLASNLGIVELTLALHRVFHMPEDKIIFDVGHQTYVHKMITGRANRFSTLRTFGGLAGFPKRSESEYDCFETGHASTAISAALGIARARDYRKEKYEVIAVVGDGALTGGMCYEALNDAGNSKTKMIVVLNDNEMSIAQNVGALSNYLTNLRISAGWQGAKRRVRHLNDIPLIGKPAYKSIHWFKKLVKSLFIHDETEIGFFDALGFEYFGPIDGHDLAGMERAFRQAKLYNGPCVIHVLTKKGYGYNQAEERPEAFHGTPPFYIETGNRIDKPMKKSWGHIMADTLSDMSERDERIVAITAAMKLGTGLDHFAARFPDRVLDVGIAEEHAATMAAGLAAGGMRPYVAVYASFFQRCYDQMLHDICMQSLPVVFLLDRSGVGGEDGQTHHGLFDFSLTLPVPGLTVLAPSSADELVSMLYWTLQQEAPCVIRYPKTAEEFEPAVSGTFVPGKWKLVSGSGTVYLFAVGSMVPKALNVQKILSGRDIASNVVNCSTVKPLDEAFLSGLPKDAAVFTMEEHMNTGGFGEYLTRYCLDRGIPIPIRCFGVPEVYVQHGNHDRLMEETGLASEQMAEEICKALKGETTIG